MVEKNIYEIHTTHFYKQRKVRLTNVILFQKIIFIPILIVSITSQWTILKQIPDSTELKSWKLRLLCKNLVPGICFSIESEWRLSSFTLNHLTKKLKIENYEFDQKTDNLQGMDLVLFHYFFAANLMFYVITFIKHFIYLTTFL